MKVYSVSLDNFSTSFWVSWWILFRRSTIPSILRGSPATFDITKKNDGMIGEV